MLQSIWLSRYARRRSVRMTAESPAAERISPLTSDAAMRSVSRYFRSAAAMAVLRSMMEVFRSSTLRNLTMAPEMRPSPSRIGRMDADSAEPLIS